MSKVHISSPLVLRGDIDPSVAGAAAPIGCLFQNDSDGRLWSKIGKADTAWARVQAAVNPSQVFEYTCTGAEGATIVIGAGQGFVARSTTAYVVAMSIRRPMANAIKIISMQGAPGLASFTVELSASVEADDVLCFIVEDKT